MEYDKTKINVELDAKLFKVIGTATTVQIKVKRVDLDSLK